MFFSFQIFRNVPSSFLLLISGLSPLMSENVPGMTQVLLNFLVSWPRIWTFFDKCPSCTWRECALCCPGQGSRPRLGQVCGHSSRRPSEWELYSCCQLLREVLTSQLQVRPAAGVSGCRCVPAAPRGPPFLLPVFSGLLLGASTFRVVMSSWWSTLCRHEMMEASR